MIEIEADLESVYFYGEIILFKEFPIWGTGFQGKVELYVTGANDGASNSTPSGDMGFGAMALFGTTANENEATLDVFSLGLFFKFIDLS